MRAIQIEEFGDSKVLRIKDVGLPQRSSNQMIVKISAAGVNPVDTYIRQGAFVNLPKLPFIPGKDGAGIVNDIGKNESKFKVGQRVFICGRNLGQFGTYAEYTAVDEEDVFPLDDRLSFEEGAALGIPYFTAYRALVLKAKCVPQETVLIHGASGAVGLAAVQIAKHLQLKVIGTAGSADGLAVVKESGADHVLDHKDPNYMDNILEITENAGVNIIIEMLANVNLDEDLEILAPRGRITVVGSRGAVKIDPRKMMVPETEIIGVALLSSSKDEWKETSEAIVDGITEGWVKPVIDMCYPLSKAAKAHDDVIRRSGGAKGKLVISVENP